MSEIDWSKAPEGATHRSATAWFKRDEVGVYLFDAGMWRLLPWGKSQLDGFWERPSPAWNGEGLPPVGTVCEALWNESRNEWLKTKVFGVNEHEQPVHRWEEGPKKFDYQASPLTGFGGKPYFRPIRTPEQIAADERNAFIDEIALLLGWDAKYEAAQRDAGKIFDAGYRKQADK